MRKCILDLMMRLIDLNSERFLKTALESEAVFHLMQSLRLVRLQVKMLQQKQLKIFS